MKFLQFVNFYLGKARWTGAAAIKTRENIKRDASVVDLTSRNILNFDVI